MARQGENSLGRLNEVLFAELERLDALDVSDDKALRAEIERSKAVQGVAKEINISARSVLDTAKLRAEWAGARVAQPSKLLEG
jgi:hypothetical protein